MHGTQPPPLPSARLILNAIRCDGCHRVLVSNHRHDFRQCACGNFTDGGRDYIRRGIVDGITFTDLSLYFVPEKDIIMLGTDLAALQLTISGS